MKVENVKQVLGGAAVSTFATKAAIEAFPKLRPLEPAAQVITIIVVVGSLLLLAEKGQLRW